jgi:hypothetical protein
MNLSTSKGYSSWYLACLLMYYVMFNAIHSHTSVMVITVRVYWNNCVIIILQWTSCCSSYLLMLSGKLEAKIGWIVRLIYNVKLVWKFKEHCECEYKVVSVAYSIRQWHWGTVGNIFYCCLFVKHSVSGGMSTYWSLFLLSILSLLIVNMNVIKLRHIKKSIQYLQLCSLKVSFLHAESWCSFRDQNLLCKKTRHNADIVL